MTPNQIREQLPIYADGELSAEQCAELEQRLAASAELRAELNRWRALRTCCRRVVEREVCPAGLRGQIAAELSVARRRRVPYRLFGAALATAAALAAGVFVYQKLTHVPGGGGGGRQVAGLDVTASQFAMIYRMCALNHDDKFHQNGKDPNAARVELAASQGYALLMPDLTASGYNLDGVCPCFPEKGVKAIHAFYSKKDQAQDVVSFFSIDRCVKLKQCRAGQCCKQAPAKRSYDLAIDNEVTLVKWDERGRTYAVVGRMGSDELLQLASSVDVAALDSGQSFAAAGGE